MFDVKSSLLALLGVAADDSGQHKSKMIFLPILIFYIQSGQ